MRSPPLHGRQILGSLLFRHLNPLGTKSPSRSPHRKIRRPHRVHPPLRGSTRTTTVPLKRVSPSLQLECELPKHARSVAVGKPRSVIPSMFPTVSEPNEMDSAMANHRASGARTGVWSANMLANAECADRTKSRARAVIRKKLHSTPLANRRSLHQISPTIVNTPICTFQLPFHP